MAKIGVVGVGFVGNAVKSGFTNEKAELVLADPRLGIKVDSFLESKPDVVFICVPTPMGDEGKIDASIVSSVLETLSPLKNTLLVLKSTVVPNIVKEFALKYDNFIYNPEFLTEKNAVWDFQNPIMNVFGGSKENCHRLSEIYDLYSNCKPTATYFVTATEASFIKYGINSFLATKVAFWNQFEEMVTSSGMGNYNNIKDAIGEDARIGDSHMTVPGHDGRRGTSGACFGKDIPALVQYSNKSLSILREAWNYNVDVRNSYGEPLPREKEQHIKFFKI